MSTGKCSTSERTLSIEAVANEWSCQFAVFLEYSFSQLPLQNFA